MKLRGREHWASHNGDRTSPFPAIFLCVAVWGFEFEAEKDKGLRLLRQRDVRYVQLIPPRTILPLLLKETTHLHLCRPLQNCGATYEGYSH
jgi:hypothetical protein